MALLSAGLDSTVALAMARASGISIPLAITFDYGQRAAHQEVQQAKKLAEFWGISHRVFPLPNFSEIVSSSGLLAKTFALPHLSIQDLDNPEVIAESAKAVWVPNRNGVFLEMAACLAEQMKLNCLIVGFNKEEAATFPDNSPNYIRAINQALRFSTANHVEVLSPTIDLDKTQILKKALQLDIPLTHLWSCYENGTKMCGRCESCMRLKRALKNNEVGFHDLFAN